MKKVLIAFDGTQFSSGAFQFAKQLNALQPILLTGVFLSQLSYSNLWSYANAMTGQVYVPVLEDEDDDAFEENIEVFRSLCIRNDISFRVHKDSNGFAMPELKKETRFADLLIVGSEKFFEDIVTGDPTEYMKDAIREAECPVVVVPEEFNFPNRNIIAYDGSASSVYAMKQFAYLFPELSQNETMVVFSKIETDERLPSQEHIEELATQHFKDLTLQKLEVNARKYFSTWLNEEENPILVCGALGRSATSQMFRKSFVTDVIADHRFPVFIAHN
jgi:nucleotide-binding universal stress UspA family protein